ncbi:hypothetical protein ACIRBX_09840 [Kitasatospora sp. NPDC096147]|uniref:hypothetical protein n=1 Tax=Kitasatospora sp. NPDC096147 TaxID=3364093 RepID=UPI0038003A55
MSSARQVTADWARVFTGFTAWRSLRLVRRIGPVLQGITLDRSGAGDAYHPTAHLHALTRPFPVVTLGLDQRLSGASGMPEAVRFARHAADFPAAAERLAAQSVLPLRESPTVAEIVRALQNRATAHRTKGWPPAVQVVEDAVLVSAAVADRELIGSSLDLARQLSRTWSSGRLPLDWPGTDAWLAALERRAADPDALAAVVAGQIAVHGLAKVRTAA